MDKELYGRQHELPLNIPKVAVVAGIGGVGFWSALELILVGVEQLYLFDADTLAEHNLNRIPFPKEDVGKLKVNLMRQLGEKLRPDAFIFAQPVWCSPETLDALFTKVDLLIDNTDKIESQRALSKWAREHKTSYVRVGVTTNHRTVTSHVAGWHVEATEEEGEQCGVTIPSWVAPCALAASEGIIKGLLNMELERSGDVTVTKQ